MRRRLFFLLLILTGWMLSAEAQSVDPQAYYIDENKNEQKGTTIENGQAPLTVRFEANPSSMGTYTPSFEWHFTTSNKGEAARELFVRYEENTEYTFMESGSYTVTLTVNLHAPDGSIDILNGSPITIEIAESKLEFPNAFSPNGDGINDVYRAKPDYKSIVSFKATILNRWGQKLYQWNDPEGGWDGKYHGHDVSEGVYFVLVDAKGADGKEYKIKKDINLLRGFVRNGNTQ